MTDIKNLTGPELFTMGQEHLRNAYQQWEDAPQRTESDDENSWFQDFAACTQSIGASAAIAHACFAGAHAAAFGQMAADEGSDDNLRRAWADAIGAKLESE